MLCEAAYGSSRVNFIDGDVTKPETLVPACQGMDAVVCSIGARAGWRLPCWNNDTPKCVDYQGVKNLAEAAAFVGVKVFRSSGGYLIACFVSISCFSFR